MPMVLLCRYGGLTMIYLKACPRCHGDVKRTTLGNLVTLSCFQCSYTVEGTQKEAN